MVFLESTLPRWLGSQSSCGQEYVIVRVCTPHIFTESVFSWTRICHFLRSPFPSTKNLVFLKSGKINFFWRLKICILLYRPSPWGFHSGQFSWSLPEVVHRREPWRQHHPVPADSAPSPQRHRRQTRLPEGRLPRPYRLQASPSHRLHPDRQLEGAKTYPVLQCAGHLKRSSSRVQAEDQQG